MKKTERIALYKIVWCKIRYWQNLHDISDTELAASLQVGERTLHEYDKNAGHVTMEKLDSFLVYNRIEITDLLNA